MWSKPKFYIHSLLTLIPALFISNFLAVGTIGENYSNETYFAPEFFSILVIWSIGLFIMLWRPKKFRVGALFMWLAIPVGFYGTAALIS